MKTTRKTERKRAKGSERSPAPDLLAGIADASFVAPFSPVIMRASMPAPLVAAIVETAGRILGDPVLADRRKEGSPVLRNVAQRVEVLEDIEGAPAGAWLEAASLAYLLRVGAEVGRLQAGRAGVRLNAAWVNRQVQNDFVPLHLHEGTLSGVAYLRVPAGMHEELDEAGRLQFFDGRPIDPNLVRYRYSVAPSEGDVYIFPSWLQHAVYPFRRAGERWAMSFNVDMLEGPPVMVGSAPDVGGPTGMT